MRLHLAFLAAAFAAGSAVAGADVKLPVTVTVIDGDGTLIRDAVILTGNGTVLARTGDQGTALVNVERGTTLAARSGDRSSTDVAVRESTLRLTLLRVIGQISQRPNLARIGRDDPSALLGGDPAGGLAYSATRRASSEGGSSRFRINGVAIDLPLPAVGDASPIAPDLLESATPVRAPDGSIETDYHLAEPTARPAQRLEAGIGGNFAALWRAMRSGPGYAVAFAHGRDDGTLAGRTFRDASGGAYPHDTAASAIRHR